MGKEEIDLIVSALIIGKQIFWDGHNYIITDRKISVQELRATFGLGLNEHNLTCVSDRIVLVRCLFEEMVQEALAAGFSKKLISTYLGCKVFCLPQMDDEGFPTATSTKFYRWDEITLAISNGKPELLCAHKSLSSC